MVLFSLTHFRFFVLTCVSMKEFSTDAQALLVSCALGIVLKNAAATKAGLDKLRALREKMGAELAEKEFDFRLGLLEAVAHVMKDDKEKALTTIAKSVAMHSNDDRAWLRLSKFIQDNYFADSGKVACSVPPKLHHVILTPANTLYEYEGLAASVQSLLCVGGSVYVNHHQIFLINPITYLYQ